MRVGQYRHGRQLIGYEVYEAPEGCAPAYLGRATSLREARHMAARGGGLPEHLWATARAAGHCGGCHAPHLADDEVRDDEPTAWFGRGGRYCAVPVWRVTT